MVYRLLNHCHLLVLVFGLSAGGLWIKVVGSGPDFVGNVDHRSLCYYASLEKDQVLVVKFFS